MTCKVSIRVEQVHSGVTCIDSKKGKHVHYNKCMDAQIVMVKTQKYTFAITEGETSER